MVCPWQSSQASPCLLRYCNFPIISQEKSLNIGFLPAGALTPLAVLEQSCVPCQWPHKDIFSEPGREVVVEKSTPLEKGRNLEITPAEDINNGHPADSHTQSKMPLHNRKMHKTHSNAHPGLTTLQTVSILYPPELYTKQRAIFLRLRAETVGLYERFDKVYNGRTQHANRFGWVPKAQVTKTTLFLLFPPSFKVFINKHRWTQAIFLPISRHQNDFLSLKSISDPTSEIRNLKLNLLLMIKSNKLNRQSAIWS